MVSILDAGFLYALLDKDDVYHTRVASCMTEYRGRIVLPAPAITETAYLVRKNLGINALATFVESLSIVDYEIEIPTALDFVRAAQIIRKYNDTNIDFVDACIFAMAERFNIKTILTVDRRHFSVFRPDHCEVFEILP